MGIFTRRKPNATGSEEKTGPHTAPDEILSPSPESEKGSSVRSSLEPVKSPYNASSNPVSPPRGSSSGKAPTSQGRRSSHLLDYRNSYSDDEDEEEEGSVRVRRKWKSSRLAPGTVYEKPWVNEKIPRRMWEKIIFASGCALGALLGGYVLYSSWSSVTNSEYCQILDENFETIDESIWNYEIQRGGFGTGSFEWTTTSPENIYVDGAGLHIIPTLTVNTTNITEAQMLNGATLNLTTAGICTSTEQSACSIKSNTTSGDIINPVRSARINTQGKRTIKYGKVEVVAKLPKGDWLWPAIWMMPQDDIYGVWPQSGEIDIMESRGNAPPFDGGRQQVQSTLHWGPNQDSDGYWRTMGLHSLPRTDYSEDFHMYGLEWSSKYLFMYLDSRLLQVLFVKFNSGGMWNRGEFGTNTNQSALNDPWSWTGRPNTPFDQEFYLILNLAIGGTNGFFVDSVGNKPWVNNNENAQRAFWESVGTWLPTWGAGDEKGLSVKSVKMYSLGAC